MKKHLRLFLGLFLFLIIFFALTQFQNKDSQIDLSSREPSGVIDSGFLALTEDIYTTTTSLVNVPIELIKDTVIRITINNYLSKLPLKKDVRSRLEARLNDDKYLSEIVPFLMALKDQYSEPDIAEDLKFENYARNHRNQLAAPGSEHELFSWVSKAEPAKKDEPLLTYEVAANIASVYDVVFIQGKSIITDKKNLERPFQPLSEKDQNTINKVKPIVQGLLEKVKSKSKGDGKAKDGGANSEAFEMLDVILKDQKKLEAFSISIIDFIKYMVHKSYRYFAFKHVREMDLRRWLEKKLDAGEYTTLLKYLHESQRRRYAVQFGVDGLQGNLLRALAQPENNLAFLNSIKQEFTKANLYKPKSEPTEPPNHGHSTQFLQYLIANKTTPNSYLPFFKYLFGNYSQNISTGGISTTPTISVRNLPIIFTGAEVAGKNSTGIPNFHFVDRKDPNYRSYYFYGNDALMLESLSMKSGMITMFERFRKLSTLNCNAQYEWHSHFSYDGLLNLGLGEGSRDFGELRCYSELLKRAENESKLRDVRNELISLVKEIKGSFFTFFDKRRAVQVIEKLSVLEGESMPQYMLMYMPWPDHFAHFKGPFSDEIIGTTGELNRLDYWLGKITETYRKAGLYDRTIFGMAGDHGLSPVFHTLNPEKTVLEKMQKEYNRKIKIKKISSDEGEGPKINHNLRPDSMKDYDVIIASTAGGNYMLDFFNGQTDELWRQQPVYEDLTHVKLLDGGAPLNMVKELANRLQETLEYMAVREKPCGVEECDARIITTKDGRRVDELIRRRGKKILYVPYDQQNQKSILQISEKNPYREYSDEELKSRDSLLYECLNRPNPQDPNTWCSEDQWRLLASFTPRPDSVVQLSHLYDEDRAGTINLFPKYGIGYNTKVPGRHAGESFHEKDAFIGFWGSPTRSDKTKNLGPVVNGSLAPTIYSYMTESDGKGFGFPSVWNQIKK